MELIIIFFPNNLTNYVYEASIIYDFNENLIDKLEKKYDFYS